MDNKLQSGYIDPNLLKEAINLFGEPDQTNLLEEECIELALAIQKLKRKRGDLNQKIANIEDELADVIIMIEQAKKMFNMENVNKRIDFKMSRLQERLIEKLS